MSELTSLTIAQAREKLLGKEITAVELTDAYLAEIEAANKTLNAYIEVTPENAKKWAAISDEKIAKGEAGALEGIPVGIKDLFGTQGVHTQACSHILDGFKPKYESTVTQNMWDDGAVMLGKLNMDEFAMGSSNETSYYGAVTNPWKAQGDDTALVPGGSSGGSAAAVAAQLCVQSVSNQLMGVARAGALCCIRFIARPSGPNCKRRSRCSNLA